MISISILNIKDDIKKIKAIDMLHPNYIHLDVMDNEFVSNSSNLINIPILNSELEVHLMVKDIKKYVDEYKKLDPKYIIFHYEAAEEIDYYINYIKSLGIKVGISIKPKTDVDKIIPYLEDIDLVLVMSVEPGYGGQKFIDNSEFKINKLVELRDKMKYKYYIEVDGGINNITKDKVKKADILVVGSYITMDNNYQERYNEIK